jgi:serine/threonine protein kinase
MGAVYEVEHVHTGQRLALKVIAGAAVGADAVERFKREARASSRIKSDHVVRVTDADVAPELDGAPFLVMELLEGSDLEAATAGGPASPADVVVWLDHVARALGRAHELGIVHRDLKPENLFLTHRDDGMPLVKILDFGIAKVVADGQKTRSGTVLGTPLYMAPEQADPSASPPTAKTDLFALGLIAHRLLVGKSYWKDGSLAQLVTQILYEPMVLPSARESTLGPRFDAWFLHACARDPDKRFSSAQEQVAALAAALDVELVRAAGALPRASAPTPPTSQPKMTTLEGAATLSVSSSAPGPPRRRLAFAATAIAVALALVGVVVWRVRAPQHAVERHVAANADEVRTSAPVAISADPKVPLVISERLAAPSASTPALATQVTGGARWVPKPTGSASAATSARPTRSADPLGSPY